MVEEAGQEEVAGLEEVVGQEEIVEEVVQEGEVVICLPVTPD